MIAGRAGSVRSVRDRLLDLLPSSRLDQLEAAFRALGKRITIVVEEAA
ncbi:MAG TPA: hypothetical protein VMJ75_22015 [Candidatus Acidoferrales bacterium]|nr:hypothetical protein [Candidatus Acidoferrales bacterium]